MKVNLQIDIIKSNYLIIRFKNISVPIDYLHEQYTILTIDCLKLKSTIHPSDIGTKISTGTLLNCHYFYIHSARYYPLFGSDCYRILAIETIRTSYLHMDHSKDI